MFTCGVQNTEAETIQRAPLGSILVDNTNCKAYMYVYNAGTNAIANGTLCYHKYTTGNVTTDGTLASYRNTPAGIGIYAIAAASYGYIQIAGRHLSIKTNGDDDIARGDKIIGASSSVGLCNSAATTAVCSTIPFGVAITADVDGSNTVDGLIRLFMF